MVQQYSAEKLSSMAQGTSNTAQDGFSGSYNPQNGMGLKPGNSSSRRSTGPSNGNASETPSTHVPMNDESDKENIDPDLLAMGSFPNEPPISAPQYVEQEEPELPANMNSQFMPPQHNIRHAESSSYPDIWTLADRVESVTYPTYWVPNADLDTQLPTSGYDMGLPATTTEYQWRHEGATPGYAAPAPTVPVAAPTPASRVPAAPIPAAVSAPADPVLLGPQNLGSKVKQVWRESGVRKKDLILPKADFLALNWNPVDPVLKEAARRYGIQVPWAHDQIAVAAEKQQFRWDIVFLRRILGLEVSKIARVLQALDTANATEDQHWTTAKVDGQWRRHAITIAKLQGVRNFDVAIENDRLRRNKHGNGVQTTSSRKRKADEVDHQLEISNEQETWPAPKRLRANINTGNIVNPTQYRASLATASAFPAVVNASATAPTRDIISAPPSLGPLGELTEDEAKIVEDKLHKGVSRIFVIVAENASREFGRTVTAEQVTRLLPLVTSNLFPDD
jgi:hypothetical protein